MVSHLRKSVVAMKVTALGALLVCVTSGVAFADQPPEENFQERIAAPIIEESPSCDSGARLSAGVANWFFEEENSTVAPALHMDIWDCGVPLNFRFGIEGRHFDVSQPSTVALQESPGATVELTILRIPFAVEYMLPLSDDVTWYIGGGPDILHVANDASDTSVGLHLGTRIGYEFTDHLGVALEAGYMWGDVDGEGAGDVELDMAYVSPYLTYRF